MFAHCSKLASLPDISKWNALNIKSTSYILRGCYSLQSTDVISKWNAKYGSTNVIYL